MSANNHCSACSGSGKVDCPFCKKEDASCVTLKVRQLALTVMALVKDNSIQGRNRGRLDQ